MNGYGYISNSLTFTNSLHQSQKYPRRLESFNVSNSDAHYFMDDLFQMILLNLLHIDKIQIRIIESEYNNNEDWSIKSTNNLYYSYHHNKSKIWSFETSIIK